MSRSKDKETIDFLIKENMDKGERIRELEELNERKDDFFKAMISDGLRHGSSLAGKHMADLREYYADPEGYYNNNNNDNNDSDDYNEPIISREEADGANGLVTIIGVAVGTGIAVYEFAPTIKKTWQEKIKPKASNLFDKVLDRIAGPVEEENEKEE